VARYFFHFYDGTDQPDETGTEFAHAKAARDAAVVFMGEKLRERRFLA